VTTYGERAVDVFYVKDLFGLKIVHAGKLAEIKGKLETVLQAADRKEGLEDTPLPTPERAPRRSRTAAE
jgi:[protein-PII] uridylyltransferase